MDTLIFEDVGGNGLQFAITPPEDQNQWRFTSFLEFMKLGPESGREEGFLFTPEDPISHERFTFLLNKTASTLNETLEFYQDGRRITEKGSFLLGNNPPLVEIRRTANKTFKITPESISLKERNRSVFKKHERQIADAIDLSLNRKTSPNHLRHSISSLVHNSFDQETLISCLLEAARIIHRAPFENWSKFQDKIPFRNGHEMWLNYANGAGGVCSEKTSSLKFICDLLGIETRSVIGTEIPLKSHQLKSLSDFFLSAGTTPPPCDIKHLLLEVCFEVDVYLVDVTGGNVPLMFLNQSEAKTFFESGYSVRMVSRTDKLFLSRIPLWVGDAHLTVCEYHLPDAHFDLTFDQELGLEITDHQYTGAFFDYGSEHSGRMRKHYQQISARQNLAPPLFINKTTKPDQPIERGIEFYQNARANILDCYRDKNYSGDITIVIQPLNSNFWSKPMVSQELESIHAQKQLPAST